MVNAKSVIENLPSTAIGSHGAHAAAPANACHVLSTPCMIASFPCVLVQWDWTSGHGWIIQGFDIYVGSVLSSMMRQAKQLMQQKGLVHEN